MTEINNVANNIRPTNDEPVITAQELRELFLFGVNLQDENGNEMPDTLLEHYIDAAQEWIDTEIPGIVLKQQNIVDETHDYYVDDYMQFGAIRLFRFPVISISKWAIQFPLQTDLLSFDPSWLRVESFSGYVNLVPTEGTLSSIILGQGGSFLPLLYNALDHVPAIIHLDYIAGHSDKKKIALIKNLVGKKASLGPLNIAGDLIAGAGIASKSISIDGLSQSIGTTSSATNAGYGARMINYNKEIDTDLKKLRNWHQGIKMVVA